MRYAVLHCSTLPGRPWQRATRRISLAYKTASSIKPIQTPNIVIASAQVPQPSTGQILFTVRKVGAGLHQKRLKIHRLRGRIEGTRGEVQAPDEHEDMDAVEWNSQVADGGSG